MDCRLVFFHLLSTEYARKNNGSLDSASIGTELNTWRRRTTVIISILNNKIIINKY